MKAHVALQAAVNYDRRTIEDALGRLLSPLGGMGAFVKPGQKVLVKPNMLAGKSPDKAVTTHPEIVRGVIRLAQNAGGIVSVGDSPGVGSPRQVAARCGILSVIEETGAHFALFAESTPVRPSGHTFQQLELARDVLEADVIINLPKLKTHQMMGMTCAVKNLFGAVVGIRKPRLHLQAGEDKAFFALMLLDLAEHLKPALTIVDAVVGMEGDGPGSGDPVHIGALLAGEDPVAVDTAAFHLVGVKSDSVWTQRVARESGRPGTRFEEIEVLGAEMDDFRLSSFKGSKSTDIHFGLPTFLREPLKRSLTARPAPDMKLCELCGLCIEHCPPRVMAVERNTIAIDYSRCIGCFCCQELCPRGAIETRQGLLLRLSRYLGR